MKKQEYAIVDIETTGGNASGSRITEIAIIIHDGVTVIDRWETLVNPQKEIPLPIFALTGINNEMVRDAPIFDDISEKVLEMLAERIFVAHNVNFDYSFVRHQLEESGFKWTAKKLCTVRAARKIRPGFGSYSLGNLCRSLEIPVENRHRAGGDADATAILFSRLMEWDDEGEIEKMVKKTAQDQRLPPNLPPEDFEQLPEKPGVYYFYNQVKKVIYVGKAVNLKKRVASHFTGHNVKPQRQHFLRDIHGISL
jgi:DNA polymerase-3 subunit epsilon